MSTRSEAEENLRTIRSLMERSTIYRAISAPVALVGGVAALVGCGFVAIRTSPSALNPTAVNLLFMAIWMGVLVIAGLSNIFFLWQDAKRRGDIFISAGMRAALRALWPNYIVALLLTVLWANSAWMLPVPWMILHGLGLLATQHFAPRSITLLGWAFLSAGLLMLLPFSWPHSFTPVARLQTANLAMGATFGLFHLVYAACTWPRKSNTAPVHEP